MSGISFDNFFCLFQRTFPVQISKNLFVSQPLHGHHPSCIATFLKRRNFFYKSLLKHSIHSFVDSLIKIGPVIIQHKIGRIIGRFFFPFFGIVFGNLFTGLMIEFQGTDHTFYIVGMNFKRRLFIHLPQHLMQLFCTFFLCQFFQLFPVGMILLIVFKRNVIQQSLDIKPGSTYNNRDMSSLIDPIQRFFCHLLEFHHMELFLRLQHIDQMVRDPLHLF